MRTLRTSGPRPAGQALSAEDQVNTCGVLVAKFAQENPSLADPTTIVTADGFARFLEANPACVPFVRSGEIAKFEVPAASVVDPVPPVHVDAPPPGPSAPLASQGAPTWAWWLGGLVVASAVAVTVAVVVTKPNRRRSSR